MPRLFSALLRSALCSAFCFTLYGFSGLGFSTLQNAQANESCQNCVRIAILPLKHLGDQEKIGLYTEGVQESLIQSLSSISSIIVLDRARTGAILKEISFQQSMYADEKTQVKIGKMLGAEYLYTGSVQELKGQLRIFISRINVSTGQVNAVAQVTGPVDDLFALQDQVAQKILTQMSVANPTEQKKNLHEKKEGGTSSLMAYESFIRGLRAQEKEDWETALSFYNQAIAIDAKYAFAYTNRGNIYRTLKADDKAMSDYNLAIQFAPGYSRPYNNKGNIQRDRKRYEQALLSYTQAIQRDLTYLSPYMGRGNTYRDLEQYTKAIADYNQAIVLDPNFALAYVNRGFSYHGLKQYKKAIADYNQAIVLDPKDDLAYFNRGISFYALGQYIEAIFDQNQVLQLTPQDADAYYVRGNAYYALKQDPQAINDFRISCQLGLKKACAFLDK